MTVGDHAAGTLVLIWCPREVRSAENTNLLGEPSSLDSRAPRSATLAIYLMCIPEIARAITSCCISAVPSKMS